MNRILVIGLRTEQARKLKQQYADCLDIDYNPNQIRHTQCLSNMDNYNKIIVCTKFTNHSTHKICKKHRGYVMTSGGFSSVKMLLNEFGGIVRAS